MTIGTEFSFYRGRTLLGLITITGYDQPFIKASFKPSEEYHMVKDLFDKELSYVSEPDFSSKISMWEDIYKKILKPGLYLISVQEDQEYKIKNPLIHIEGDCAWFRPKYFENEKLE